MKNKEMEYIKMKKKKKKMEKIIKEVEREYPDDFALQQVRIARRLLAEEAREKGMSLWEYTEYLRNLRNAKEKDKMQGKDNEKDNEQWMMILSPKVKKTLRSLIDEHLRERGWNLANFSEIKLDNKRVSDSGLKPSPKSPLATSVTLETLYAMQFKFS